MEFLERLKSRKFIAAILAAVVAFGNAFWGWGMTVEEVMVIAGPLLAYIGVEGIADVKERKRG